MKAQDACTASSFQGPYGYTFQGTATTADLTGPFVSAGRLVSDGNGKFTGGETASINGETTRREYIGGYTVNADCTGTAILNDKLGAMNNYDFVIVEGGRKLLFVQTDPGTSVSGVVTPQ